MPFDAPGASDAALSVLRAGGVIVVPTDTVYALAGLPTDPRALRWLWRAGSLATGTALPLLLADLDDAARLVANNPPPARRLAAACWPGPLTLVLRRAPGIRGGGAGDDETVALRVPAHDRLRALIRAAGGALATVGLPAAASVAAARALPGTRAALALDGGVCPGGESSIVDCSRTPYRLLREGLLLRREIVRLSRARLG